jgi:hypothetical protein
MVKRKWFFGKNTGPAPKKKEGLDIAKPSLY